MSIQHSLVYRFLIVFFIQFFISTFAFAAALSLNSQPAHDQRVGTLYSQTNVASGGTGSYTYSVSAGTLPAGISLNTSTGTASGTPTSVQSFSYNIRVNDGVTSVTNTVSGSISSPSLNMLPNSFPNPQRGVFYSQTVVASGGTAPYTYVVSQGALPPGITLNAATGVFSGIPTSLGTKNFTFTATDSTTGSGAPYSFQRAYNVTVTTGPTLALASSTSSATQIGVAYSQTNVASGGSGSYTYSISAGALPAGLSLSTTSGTVSGTPTAAGAFSYTVRVSDGSNTKTQVISGTMAAPTIAINPSLPSGTVNTAYSQTLVATGGTIPYVYAVSAGTLPAGLSLNTSTGAITGTPTTTNTFNFTIRATDSSTGTSAPFSNTRAYAVAIASAPLLLNSNASNSTQIGVAYLQTNAAIGGTGSYTYSVSAGTIPAGLSLNTSTGTVSGTPTVAGAFSYTIQVSDGSTTATQVISGTIAAPSIVINPSLPSGTVGTAYSQTILASGGTASYVYAVSVGTLPTGLSLNGSTGVISGTPTTATTYNFTIRATDSSTGTGAPFSNTRAYAVTIANPDLVLNVNVSSETQIGLAYSQTSTTSGGSGSYTYSVSAGALPAGLSLNTSTGTVSGTPTAAGTFTYTIQVSDGATTATQVIAGTIAAPNITIGRTVLPVFQVGVPISASLFISGGTAPYTIARDLTAVFIPIQGVSANPITGTFSGTPTAAGPYSITIKVTDSSTGTGAPFSNTRTFTGTVLNADLILNSNVSTSSEIGDSYSQTNVASGGTGSYTYSVSAGAIPAGLSLNTSTGTVSGTPTAAGAFSYTIQVSDGSTTATQVISGTMAAPNIGINPSLPSGTVGTAYSQTITAIGATAPYTFAVSAGALPTGLSLNTSTGAITGTPATANTFNFTIRATDSSTGTSAPFSNTRAYAVTIANPDLVLSSTTSSETQIGAPYSQTNTASGGTGSYTYSVSVGALPAGLSLNTSTGTVSGTPTAAGAFSYTIQASDGVATATRVTSGTISAPTITVDPITLQQPETGVAYSDSITTTGGTAPYTYAVSAGTLPAGLSLNTSTGAITGTPTTANTFNFTIRSTDSSTGTGAPFSQSRAYSVTVISTVPPLALSSSAPNVTQISESYSQDNTASGGTGSYTYSVSSGALPAGLSLNTSTGTVSGIPTAAGAFSYTIQVSDGSTTATKTTSGTVAAPNLTISRTTLQQLKVGVPVTETLVGSGGTAPYTIVGVSGNIPGLSLNVSGTVSGTPTTAGPYTVTVQVTDSSTGTGAPFSHQQTFTGTVLNADLVLNVNASGQTQIGLAYSQTSTTSGGSGSYTYFVSAGALPTGLSLNTSTGTVSGTPTAAGAFSYTIQVSDGSTTATQLISGSIAAPNLTISRTSLQQLQVGVPFSETLVGSGGTAPYTIVGVSGNIPGLSLDAFGTVSGTPTTAGPYTVTVQVTDSSTGTGAPFSHQQTFTGAVLNADLVLTSELSTSIQIGNIYSQTNTASGGTGSYTYSDSAGAIPAGLSLNTSTGTVSGTPTAAGAFTYTIQVSDGSTTATQVTSGTIAAPSIVINPSLPSGIIGTAYSQTIVASGGTAPYTYAVSAGALATGLSLNTSTGAITGTPTTANTFNFTIRATDSSTGTGAPFSNTRAYTVTINNTTLVLDSATSTSTKIGVAYSQTNIASGGTGSYTYSVSAGAILAGLSLNTSTGTVAGTPTAAGVFSYTIQVSDGATTATQSISGTIAPPTITDSLVVIGVPRVGVAFTATDPATGGTAPYTYVIVAGALTAGLSLNASTGTVSGTPTVAGPFSVTIRATDSSTGTGAPFSATQTFTGTVLNATLVLSSSTSSATQIGVAYSQTNVASGGTGSYTYSVSAGALPAGLSLNSSTGTVSGTPTAAGVFSYTIRVSDGATTTTQVVSGTIAAPSIVINPSLPSGTVGIVYSQTIVGSGGIAPYTYAVSAGALPTGLSLNTSTGAITGTPTTANTFNFTIRATDAGLFTNTRVYSVVINSSTLVASNFSITVPYNSQGQAIPLAAHTNEAITSATLLSLPTHGSASLSGTVVTYIPTRGYTGADSFTFTASNAGGTSLPATATITIANRPDPSLDPDVRGLIAAQTEAVQRYADSQVSNIANRLQNLHHSTALLENGIRFNFGDCASAPTSGFMGHAMSSPFTPTNFIGPDDECAARAAMFGQLQQSLNSLLTTALVGSDNATGANRDLSFWTAGTINFGSVAGQDRNFTSSGLTIGVDKRLSDELVFGVAAGYGMDDSNIGSDGTHVTNHNVSGSVYGSYQPFKMLFIDAMAGFGQTSFTTRRFIPSDNIFVMGDRSGNEWFGSLSVSSEISGQNFSFAPYARLDMLHATLDGFTETGSDVWALHYDSAQISSLTAVAGLRGTYDIPQSWGVLTPSVSLEYRHLTNAAGIQNLGYADVVGGTSYGVVQTNLAADSFIGSIGLRAQTDSGWIANLEYGASVSGAGLQSQQIRASITVQF